MDPRNIVAKYPFEDSTLAIAHPNVQKAIDLLKEIDDFDGETMEYIITQMCMREQMIKQLNCCKLC